jgi:hypothetical protein
MHRAAIVICSIGRYRRPCVPTAVLGRLYREIVMGAAENKKLMQELFAELARGERTNYWAHVADDFRLTVTGQYSWSHTFEGKETAARELYGYVRSRLKEPGKTTAHRSAIRRRGEALHAPFAHLASARLCANLLSNRHRADEKSLRAGGRCVVCFARKQNAWPFGNPDLRTPALDGSTARRIG